MNIKIGNLTDRVIVTRLQLAKLYNDAMLDFCYQYKKENGVIVSVKATPIFNKLKKRLDKFKYNN